MECNSDREIAATFFCVLLSILVIIETTVIAVLLIRVIKGIKVYVYVTLVYILFLYREQEIIVFWNWILNGLRNTVIASQQHQPADHTSHDHTIVQPVVTNDSNNTTVLDTPRDTSTLNPIESLAMVMTKPARSITTTSAPLPSCQSSTLARENLALVLKKESANELLPPPPPPSTIKQPSLTQNNKKQVANRKSEPVVIFTSYDEISISNMEHQKQEEPFAATPYEIPMSTKGSLAVAAPVPQDGFLPLQDYSHLQHQ